MNNPQAQKRSHVVPKWLEYQKAIRKGELVFPRKSPFEINEVTKRSIQIDLEEFQVNHEPSIACRLMGAAIVVGDKQLAHDMARFIAKTGGVDLLSIRLADKILNIDQKAEVSEADVRIAKLRKWVTEYPNSAIAWIDLSRAYTIKGQDQKAKKVAMIALQLAPHDRYVVRCAVRLFLHTNDLDLAWHYVKKASRDHFDPWIKATEINVALISDNKVPDNIKRQIPQKFSDDQLFHYSEFLESVGFLDLISGNDRKARKQFRLAWTKPSDNVITHAEWLLRNRLPVMMEAATLDFDRSHEARTWINYFDLKLTKAIEAAMEWELEEPYSKFPFIVGSTIACNAGQPTLGTEIATRGLMVAPHDRSLYNNLCYALLRAGKVEEAGKYINKLKVKNGTDADLYCQATLGLYKFANKNTAAGRLDYLDVINQFKQARKYDLQAEALLNLALAELDASTVEARVTAVKSLEMTEMMKAPTIFLLRKLVQDKLNLFGDE